MKKNSKHVPKNQEQDEDDHFEFLQYLIHSS